MHPMTITGANRNRQLVTVTIGVALALVMGAVLIFGFRLATQMRTNVTALQTASTLQTYPETLSQQLSSLRDRHEARAYAGQALYYFKTTVKSFDTQLEALAAGGYLESADLKQALLLWRQYGPVINPVVNFTGQAYIDSDAGSSFSK